MGGARGMKKQGFHRWAWLIVFLLGGLLMIYGGAQDIAHFFFPGLVLIPPWYLALPLTGLVCGLIVVVSAGLNIIWGWQLRYAEDAWELTLARRVALVSAVAMIADWFSGYYGFGSLMALLISIWLMRRGRSL